MENADLTEKSWTLQNIKLCDIEIQKKKNFITIKVLFFKKNVDTEKILVSNKISFGQKKPYWLLV